MVTVPLNVVIELAKDWLLSVTVLLNVSTLPAKDELAVVNVV